MANVTLKREEDIVTLEKEEDILVSIQSLQVEEACLTEQKENLTTLLSKLETKAKEIFKKRKRKIDQLNSEVADLQEKCNQFIRWINLDSTVECSQATQSADKDGDAKEPSEVEATLYR
jgi:chromosome segregation ATPase